MSDFSDNDSKKRHDKVKFKTPIRYRLSFFNENTLNRVWTIGMSKRRVIILLIAAVMAVFCLGAMLVAFTPLRDLLPGYLRVADRREYLSASARIDSLLEVVAANDLYINNINAIIAGDINTDSLITMAPITVPPSDVDSLLQPSEAESRFIHLYSEREGFSFKEPEQNAVDAPHFDAPVRDAMVMRGSRPERPSFILPEGKNTVYTIATATVIDCYKTDNGTYIVTLQHPDGFVSRYTGLTQVYHDRGGRIAAGGRIGVIRDGSDPATPFAFELYRDAIPLNPLRYVDF